MPTPTKLWIAALLLIPSAWFLWTNGDVPRFGKLHDDSLYFVSAKSLAQGNGYRIESLPGEPTQTKYPPLYPALLSLAWRLNPQFPQNLNLAAWLSWLALPVILLELFFLLRRFSRHPWFVLAAFALNPYVILFCTQLMSELWFLAFILAAMLLLEQAAETGSIPLAIAAGAVAGLAYLTRSAAIAFFAAGAIYLWIQNQRKLALSFAAASAPFAIAWMTWVRLNQTPTDDPQLIYYLDYFRYQLYAISLSDTPVVLWKNIDGLLAGLGGLILPQITGSFFEKILSQVIAAAMISGVVRLVRQRKAVLYALFAAFSAAMLLVWHFPPNERFVLPLFPLALAGLAVEGQHFWSLLRSSRQHKDRSQRIVAMGMTGFASAAACVILALQVYVAAVFLPEDAVSQREANLQRHSSYRWLAANTPSDAAVLSADDALLYLHTGRKAMRRPVPPFLWYREDHPGTVAWLGEPVPYARQHNLRYFDFAGVDISLGVNDEDSAAIRQRIESSADLSRVLREGPVTVYEIRPEPSSAQLRTEPTPPAR